MFLDQQCKLSTAQAVTATAVSANTFDMTTARNLFSGTDIYLVIKCDTTATAAGAATVEFQLVNDTAANLGTATMLATTGAIGKASLVGNTFVCKMPVPPEAYAGGPAAKRYIGVNYLVSTGPLTAGAFTSVLVSGVPEYVATASGMVNK